ELAGQAGPLGEAQEDDPPAGDAGGQYLLEGRAYRSERRAEPRLVEFYGRDERVRVPDVVASLWSHERQPFGSEDLRESEYASGRVAAAVYQDHRGVGVGQGGSGGRSDASWMEFSSVVSAVCHASNRSPHGGDAL